MSAAVSASFGCCRVCVGSCRFPAMPSCVIICSHLCQILHVSHTVFHIGDHRRLMSVSTSAGALHGLLVSLSACILHLLSVSAGVCLEHLQVSAPCLLVSIPTCALHCLYLSDGTVCIGVCMHPDLSSFWAAAAGPMGCCLPPLLQNAAGCRRLLSCSCSNACQPNFSAKGVLLLATRTAWHFLWLCSH